MSSLSDGSLAPKRSSAKRTASHITKRGSGIRAELHIDVQSRDQVLAHLQLTNLNAHEFWLYKPLLGDGKWEEIFYVLTNPRLRNLPYIGPHTEKYEDDKHGPLIFVYPCEDADCFVILAPGETYTTTLNLSEVYDFAQHPGEYFVAYSVRFPAMQDGRHEYGIDPLDGRSKRIYYSIRSISDPLIAKGRFPITVA